MMDILVGNPRKTKINGKTASDFCSCKAICSCHISISANEFKE